MMNYGSLLLFAVGLAVASFELSSQSFIIARVGLCVLRFKFEKVCHFLLL